MTPIALNQLPTLRPADLCIDMGSYVRIDSGGTSYECGAPLSMCLGALGLPPIDAPVTPEHSWEACAGGWTNVATGEVLGMLTPQGSQGVE